MAIAGKIHDPENTGFGPMWSSHIQSDEFVMKKFGCIEGYGKYGERIKVPNAEGEMWKILVKDFMGSPAKLDKLQSEKTKLENGYRQQAELMTRQAKIPHEKISEQEITKNIMLSLLSRKRMKTVSKKLQTLRSLFPSLSGSERNCLKRLWFCNASAPCPEAEFIFVPHASKAHNLVGFYLCAQCRSCCARAQPGLAVLAHLRVREGARSNTKMDQAAANRLSR